MSTAFFDDGDSSGSEEEEEVFSPITGEAIVFIECVNDTFKVNQEAVAFLAGLQGPISVVAVAGLYRTGKSFLLNRILLNAPPNSGFSVGNTTRACTRGIWLWKHPIIQKDKNGNDVNVLICDSEGLGAPTADASHDTRIFALALLLSSYFIYNSIGTIDEQALSNLSLVTNISKEIRVSSSDENTSDISQFLPAFNWLVRDFSLQMQDSHGQPIQSKEYLEDALKDVTEGKSIKAKNKIRSALRTYFPVRDCVCLVRPCVNESNLQKLDTLPLSSLRPEFTEQATKFRATVMSSSSNRPNQLNGVMLSGAMLAQLAIAYVNAINDGKVPVIQDAWTYMCNAQQAKACEELLATFHSKCGELLQKTLSPPQFAGTVNVLKGEMADKFRLACAGIVASDELDGATTNFIGGLVSSTYENQNTLKYANTLKESAAAALEPLEDISAFNNFNELKAALDEKYVEYQTVFIDPLSVEAEFVKSMYTEQANGVWYKRALSVVQKFIPQFYGAREQMISTIKSSLESAEGRLVDVIRSSEVAINDLRAAAQEQLQSAMDEKELEINRLQEEKMDTKEIYDNLQQRILLLENTIQENTSSHLDDISTLTQELQAEKMKTEALTKDIDHLTEELEEFDGHSGLVEEQTREISELTFERDRLLKENVEMKRTVAEQKKAINSVETTFREEAKVMQTKALQSLQQMKEVRKTEQAQLRSERDVAVNENAVSQGTIIALRGEIDTLTAQLQKTTSEQESITTSLRSQLSESSARLELLSKDHSAKLNELRALKKTSDKAIDQMTAANREEKLVTEREFIKKIKELETRVVMAEDKAKDHKRALDTCEERLQRKKRKTDDGKTSIQLIRAESELFHVKEQKMSAEQQLVQYKESNAALETQVRLLERDLESKITALKIQHESELCAVQAKRF